NRKRRKDSEIPFAVTGFRGRGGVRGSLPRLRRMLRRDAGERAAGGGFARIQYDLETVGRGLRTAVPGQRGTDALGAGTGGTAPGGFGAERFARHYRPEPGHADRQRGAGATHELLLASGEEPGGAEGSESDAGNSEAARYDGDQYADSGI